MKLIKPSFEIIEQQPGLEGIYKQIELAGRNCYKSEDRITEDSAEPFVDRIIKSNHGAVLEFGTVYLYLPPNSSVTFYKYRDNKYSYYKEIRESALPSQKVHKYITTNYRVLVENNWLDDLQYLCEPTEHHEKRITVKIICDQGVLREYTRHRKFSFAVESTRYCNYYKDRFGNQVTFILPCWCNDKLDKSYINALDIVRHAPIDGYYTEEEEVFLTSLLKAEVDYFYLLNKGWKPQQARNVLPLATKTDIVMTGFVSDWKHFFSLRSNKYGTGGAHPQASEIADPLYERFIELGLINEKDKYGIYPRRA